MYQALYRKWRPKSFADVVGQAHITQTLQAQIAQGRLSHAYLFTGTRGTGKTTCAKILSKAVNCQSPVDGNPCNQCESCLGIENGGYLDVLELDAASNNGVDHVRALRDEAVYAPASVRYRVYIVDEVHMLSTAAFNALLKILEEPPAHLIFILATTELHKVPATILSRCQRFSFKRILPLDVQRRLLEVARGESIPLCADGAEVLARLSDGALRDALSLLDQCASVDGDITAQAVLDVLGLAGNLATINMMEAILDRDSDQALSLLHQLYQDGKEVGAVLGELSSLCRDLLLRKAAPKGGDALLSGGFDAATLSRLGQGIPTARLLYLSQTVQSALGQLHQCPNRRLEAELCILKLCDESLGWDATAVEARLVRLEQGGIVAQAAPKVTKVAPVAPAPVAPAPVAPAPVAPAPAPVVDALPWDDDDRPPLSEEPPMMDAPPWDEPPFEPAPSVTPIAPTPVTPTPAPTPAPTPVAPTASGGVQRGAWWRGVAERCKGQLPPMYRAFMDLCEGVLDGDTLVLYANNDVTVGRLDNDRVRGIIMQEITGDGGTRILIQAGDPPKEKLNPKQTYKTC
ncbi:DNA polymerase III subunit gamma/tau [Bengtsoniella intestinalis]|uniref:DNA polymerase III subunit gamma/tau n=1 Tax=Bengtsoniella intestinalis TaxID=3073143 RepID=UPI00391FA446